MAQHLIKSTLVVGGMTTLSRILGLVRDVVIARLFGAGVGVDAFIVAFRIPNFLRRVFAEGGFSQAFVPMLAEYREQRAHHEVQALLDHTTAVLGTALLVVTAIGVVAAPLLIVVFAPGFIGDPEKQDLAAQMLRVTFPYIFFISLTALAGGILNTWRRFAVPAVTPVLLNLSLIGSAIWLAPRFEQPIVALAWGVFAAGVVQLLFQFPFLAKLGLLPLPWRSRDAEGVRRILRLMVPTLFAVSITQVNLLIDTLIASFLVTGSISWLYYSERLIDFPLGVFGIALATVIMPALSADHARGMPTAYNRTLDWAVRWVFLICVPAACGLALLSAPALAALFQYGNFRELDVQMAARSLVAFAFGLPAFVLIKVLSSAFFARQDTRTPVRAAVVAMLSNIVLNLLFVVPLRHAGLALATALSAYVNAALLYRALRKRDWFVPEPGWRAYAAKLAAAAAAMCALLYLFVPAIGEWFGWRAVERAAQLVLWVAAGGICYFAMLWLCGIRPKRMTAPGGPL
ncbi:MAG TPA: murein biosynthesis integral membrane protein MurJ [Gammaproteobacteria bacterium]